MKIFAKLFYSIACIILLAHTGFARGPERPLARPFDEIQQPATFVRMDLSARNSLDTPGDVIDFKASLVNAGRYLRLFQADITDDNAENGFQGVNESPDDPDDGGWDWVLNWTADAHSHSTAASATNLYGATALGAYYAYKRISGPALFTTLLNAADAMVAAGPTSIRTASDIKFLLLFNELYSTQVTPTSVYANAARAKYDDRIAAIGSATALAEDIRDTRGLTQGYPNGIIAWDVGAFAVAAQMLFDRFGGTYDQDADNIAEVLYQDSFNDAPGYFDIVDDSGWDPDYANVNYWWFTLGVSGLLDAFVASGTHVSELPLLANLLLESQYSDGAFSYCYGANVDDQDWQSSAYIVRSLHAADSSDYKTAIRNGAYWIAATQDAGDAWLYGNGDHYPEIGGENTAAMALGVPADTVYVDDSWTNQTDVDLFNLATNKSLVWGYSAFSSIVNAISGVTARVVFVRPGLYLYQIHASNFTNLTIIGAGIDSTIIRAPSTTMPDIYFAGGPSRPILFLDHCTAHVSGLTIDGDGRGSNNSRMIGIAYWNSSGDLSDVSILNVRDTPLNSNPQGVGISVNHNDGLPHTVDITNVYIAGFQKNGTSFTGADITVNCDNVTTVGIGPSNVVIQNGIQYSNGASGAITNCEVQGIIWSSSLWIASSILMYQSDFVTVSNTTTTNGQTGIYSVDTDCSIDQCSFESSPSASIAGKSGVRLYSGASALASLDGSCELYVEASEQEQRARARSLDANESVTLSNSSLIGHNSAGSYGIFTLVDGDTLELNVSDCEIVSWNRGIDFTASGSGKIWPASVTRTRLSNTVNAFDNISNHYWYGNCYSDYTSNFGYPGTYEISGASIWNIDPAPNPNGCYDVNLLFEDGTIGCAASDCDTAFLYVSLATALLPNMQLELQLPAGFEVGLPALGGIVTPTVNADPYLIQSFAIGTGGGMILVDAGFQSPGSSGDSTRFIARIPIINISAASGTHAITTESCLWVDINGGEHYDDQGLGVTAIKVDCTSPVITQFTNTSACAFGSAYQTVNSFSATITDLAGVEFAWVSVAPNGGSIPVFSGGTSSPQTISFPRPADTSAFYALLTDGVCNTVTLYAQDTKCNVSAPLSVANVGRDETAPSLTVQSTIPASFCFNNTPASANYGGARLDDYLNITALIGTEPCRANTGVLTLSHVGASDYVLSLDRVNYPATDANSLDLWNWMLTIPGLAAANGDAFTFDVTTQDCAGNLSSIQQFELCVDTQLPQNAVTAFDARPAHLGVWLKWQWTAGPDAQTMRIYRSPLSGEYPAYPNDLWNNVSNYDVSAVPPSGWTLVTSQSVAAGPVSSGTNIGVANNRGDAHLHIAGADTFWLDAEVGWEDGDANSAALRDIYRYVTFVKDAGGNWSVGDTVEMLENADRSTNYWLGDFSTADAPGDTLSRGRVDTDDLGLLSAVYFTNAGGYRNIGPVTVENGFIGRGLPNPDAAGTIDFQDLAPFSFNFHSVSPVGINATEFAIAPDPLLGRSFDRLDGLPFLTLSVHSSEAQTGARDVTVKVQLRNNEMNVVKVVETILQYDRSAFELVSLAEGNAHTESGTIFTKVSELQSSNEIGIVAASCGGQSTLAGNATLATITLRKTLNSTNTSSLKLHSTKLLDNAGSIYDLDEVQTVLGESSLLPTAFALHQNYPNPFNPATQISFDLPESADIELTVFNTNGQLIATLLDESRAAGTYAITWDASALASGVYIYRLKSDRFTDTKKMILLR